MLSQSMAACHSNELCVLSNIIVLNIGLQSTDIVSKTIITK